MLAIRFDPARKLSDIVANFGVDWPPPERDIEGPVLRLAGWITTHLQVTEFLICIGSTEVYRQKSGDRADVRHALNLSDDQYCCSFDLLCNVLRFAPENSIDVWAVTSVGSSIPIVELNFRFQSPFEPGQADIAHVVSLGRSGSTFLMKSLAEAYTVRSGDRYPFETMYGAWLQRVSELFTVPAKAGDPTPQDIWNFDSAVGSAPFLTPAFGPSDRIVNAINSNFGEFINAAWRMMENYYDRIENSHAQATILEKAVPGAVLNLIYALENDSKFILLVRDPRDIYASRIRFRAQRNDPHFGFEHGQRDQFGILDIASACAEMTRVVRSYSVSRIYLVRYEDLMNDPIGTIGAIARFLSLPRRTQPKDFDAYTLLELQNHATSQEPHSGRWKTELPTSVANLISIHCADFLHQFQYDQSL